MKISITDDAEADIAEGFWFYERQAPGLGIYFRSSVLTDIDSLAFYGGIHEIVNGYHRALLQRFPFAIYYRRTDNEVTIVAILDCRRSPSWTRRRLSS